MNRKPAIMNTETSVKVYYEQAHYFSNIVTSLYLACINAVTGEENTTIKKDEEDLLIAIIQQIRDEIRAENEASRVPLVKRLCNMYTMNYVLPPFAINVVGGSIIKKVVQDFTYQQNIRLQEAKDIIYLMYEVILGWVVSDSDRLRACRRLGDLIDCIKK